MMKLERVVKKLKGPGMHSGKIQLSVTRHPNGHYRIGKRYLAKSRAHRAVQYLDLRDIETQALKDMLEELIRDAEIENVIEE